MREVDTVSQLRSLPVGALHTDDGEFVTDGDALGCQQILAVVASSAPTGIGAIDVDSVDAVGQIDITIVCVGDLGDGTGDHVVNIGVILLMVLVSFCDCV